MRDYKEGGVRLSVATSVMTIYDQGHKVCALEGTQHGGAFVFHFCRKQENMNKCGKDEIF